MQQTLTGRLLGQRGSKLLTTRGGTIAIGAAAALLAAILLLVYLSRYRESIGAGAQPTPVLVANRLIPKGTSAGVLAAQTAFQLQSVPKDHAKEGAVADPDALRGRVAVEDIYPGQQLTLADFSITTTNALPTKLSGDQRALSVGIDAVHGLVGHLSAGDRVDIYVGMNATVGGVGTPIIKLLFPNVLLLAAAGAAGGPGGTNAANFVFQVSSDDAPRLAFAADHGTIWLVARPVAGAKPTEPQIVSTQTLLALKRGG